MNKEEWQKVYDDLNRIYSDFIFAYQDYENGKNKKIREQGGRTATNLINRADYIISNNKAVLQLAIGDAKGYERAVVYEDDFLRPQYFGSSLGGLLARIMEKINSDDN